MDQQLLVFTLRTDGGDLLLGSGIDSLASRRNAQPHMGARSEASGAFKYTAVGQSKSTVSLFLMLVRLESSPKYKRESASRSLLR
jgi:hypothetical protein